MLLIDVCTLECCNALIYARHHLLPDAMTEERQVKKSRLGTDSIDDARKISAAFRQNALNIC
jgi:hypothetical protein